MAAKFEIFPSIVALELLIEYQESVVLPQLSEVEKDFVFSCLHSDDESIRRKSYGLLHALATQENIKEICEKMISHLKEIEDDFYKRDLITRITKLTEKFNETSLDWRTFVLLRLLQKSKESSLKRTVMQNIQSLLDDAKNQNNRTEECQQVGAKLKNTLSSPANAANPPEALLELYLWTLAKFSDNYYDACNDIIQIVKKNIDKENIVISAIHHLFYISTNALKGKDIPKEHIKHIIIDDNTQLLNHNSLIVQDLVHELLFVLELSDKISDLSLVPNEKSFDCTLTYLDNFVVEALEKGAPIYDPCKILVPIQSESKSPTLRFTPYNVMSDSEWKAVSVFSPKSESNLSSGSLKATNTPELWTLKGRIKTEQDIQDSKASTSQSGESKEDVKVLDFEESVIQDVNLWK